VQRQWQELDRALPLLCERRSGQERRHLAIAVEEPRKYICWRVYQGNDSGSGRPANRAEEVRMKKKTTPLLRLTLPAAAVQRLRQSGIYCAPNITVEFQQATKRHVLRGRESGGAIKQFGHYVTFCGEGGERLRWFVGRIR